MNLASIIGSIMRGGNNFGALGIGTPRSIFGGMANNPSINSLTNANAMSDYSNNVSGFQGFGPGNRIGGGLFGGSGMGIAGNMMMQTLARKAARRRQREQQNSLSNINTEPLYGGGNNETPVDPIQGDPDMFGNFDPISQMGGLTANAGSALAKRKCKKGKQKNK
tara:strand:+ start:261 stop:755 length:495 start_codon:yes stop_codon:yes gene_type:complete